MNFQFHAQDINVATGQVLKQYWGYQSFRPLQEDVIRSVLEGKDTLALMPTGGGKSLCYQVPALLNEGLCLVISPLIALMKDQVESLRKKGITAYAIYSGLSRGEVINTLKVASESNCKFLYVSPERLETALFKEYLPGLGVSMIAVDEAHCISQWGYDFRPPYLRIASLREELPSAPVIALTASATPDVQNDICDKLQFKNRNIFHQSFERPNLSYSVLRVDSRINKIIDILKNVPGTGIVYCRSRKRTKELADLIRMQGISVDHYHAGLARDERNRRQEDWIADRTRVIVCTNAFGMGIDKPNVRVVIHADSPDCLENYYQEAGRAGRDGKNAYAVFLYAEKDVRELERSVELRFPSLDDIRAVYHAICNYLQLPAESGEGEYYNFDLVDFIKKFRLNAQMVIYAIKALEQDGWMSFSEQIFLPATVRFTTNKEYLYQFERDQPQWEPLIKTLLRAYEGIFDHAVAISVRTLGRMMQRETAEVEKQLVMLHGRRVLEYVPEKDTPQILLLRDRIRSEHLSIDIRTLHKRKEKFVERIGNLVRYIHNGTECRSRIIASYFGDDKLKDCGICDNCLRRKSLNLTREEFDTINSRIISSVKGQSIHTSVLLQNLKGIKKEKAWTVINFLQSENKIELDKDGRVSLK